MVLPVCISLSYISLKEKIVNLSSKLEKAFINTTYCRNAVLNGNDAVKVFYQFFSHLWIGMENSSRIRKMAL